MEGWYVSLVLAVIVIIMTAKARYWKQKWHDVFTVTRKVCDRTDKIMKGELE